MKNQFYLVSTILFLVFLAACRNAIKEQNKQNKQNISVESSSNSFSYHNIVPTEFPKLSIDGFNFPEDSIKLYKWIHNSTQDSIYLHGWGLWVGLTSFTNQKVPGFEQPLRVFESWLTPKEMIDEIKKGNSDYIADIRSNRANLNKPSQIEHAIALGGVEDKTNTHVLESVSYNPAAAKFAIDEKIFMLTTLTEYAKTRKEIPAFPDDAITIKPVFKVLKASTGRTKFKIATWHGPPDTPIAFPESKWETYVTVDVTNSSKQEDSTYNLNDFIHYRLNDEDAYFFNKEFENNTDMQSGDIAILVGMHVTTKEIHNWTWQTFWWDPSPDAPPAPSSEAIANQRPKELVGAARNYAMSIAYYMVNPKESDTSSHVYGEPVYAFNPYLEARFDTNTFNKSLSYTYTSPTNKIPTNIGIRTNCMSCHRTAALNITNKKSANHYVGASFISTKDTLFEGELLLDFAWSIKRNVDTTGMQKYLDKFKNKN